MKNIIKDSKRGFIAILTLCILLGIAGTRVDVSAMAEENQTTTEESTVVTEDAAPELVPMMARGCGYGDLTSWNNIDHATKRDILADAGNYKSVVGNNPNIYYNSSGEIFLCGTGAYSGRTYATSLNKSWY